ncbi:MAG: hypothetical protein KDC00_03535 [Flavobacteriales bacterium]|nr:hypothetical protein [Flavobacteriales bacterium]
MSMTLRNLFLVPALALVTLSQAQTPFPALSGETAEGTSVELPNTNANGWTVVGIAYGKQASPVLEEWYEPVYLRFVAKHGLMAGAYDAEVYFVPLFVGLNKSAYEPSMKKFRKSADPEIVDHVVFSKDEAETLIDRLDMNDKSIPYIFVVDNDGRIVHRTQGAYSEEKLEAIEEVMLR